MVDLLPAVLADVADPEVARPAVEGEAPGVPEAVGDDLPLAAARVDVEAEELAEQRPRVLRAAVGVEGGAAVSEPEVEEAVGPERELAAVVVLVGLVDGQELAEALGPGGARAVLDDPRVSLEVRVVDVEARVVREVGVESEREQPLLAAGGDLRPDVQERLGPRLAARQHAHRSLLLHDEQRSRLGAREPPAAAR